MNQPAMEAASVILAAPPSLQTMAMVVGLLLIIGIVLWNNQKKRRAAEKGGSRRELTRETVRGVASQGALKDDMQRLLAELLETTRDIESQLETKFRKLDVLVGEADEKIAELKHMLAAVEKPTGKKPAARKGARTIGKQADASPKADHPADDAPVAVEHEGVYRLADEGLDSRQIAVKLDKSIGEIELILALRKK